MRKSRPRLVCIILLLILTAFAAPNRIYSQYYIIQLAPAYHGLTSNLCPFPIPSPNPTASPVSIA